MVELVIVLIVFIIISAFVSIRLIFIFTHLRPLTQDEINELADKRRSSKIGEYFSFNNGKYPVDKEFKKRMKSNGKLYPAEEKLSEFPSIAATLLKHKKHEWIIIAFEKHKSINLFWVNKGFDRARVSPYLSAEDMAKIAKQDNFKSILIFHNHPNANPSYYDCTRPSNQDIESAEIFAGVLNRSGMNLIEFICERGRHYQYFSSPSDSFLPIPDFISEINRVNNVSKSKNLSLHYERIS